MIPPWPGERFDDVHARITRTRHGSKIALVVYGVRDGYTWWRPTRRWARRTARRLVAKERRRRALEQIREVVR